MLQLSTVDPRLRLPDNQAAFSFSTRSCAVFMSTTPLDNPASSARALLEPLLHRFEDEWQAGVVPEIEPYLEEYFDDQPAKAKEFSWVRLGHKALADWN